MSVAEIPEELDDESLLPESERPVLVGRNQMAKILGTSVTTLYRWSQHPEFPVHRNGHLVLYPWRDVVDFVREKIRNKEFLPGRNDLSKPVPPKPPKRKRS